MPHKGVPGRLGDFCLIYGFRALDIHLYTLQHHGVSFGIPFLFFAHASIFLHNVYV